MSRAHCTVNILSEQAMLSIRDSWIANRTLIPIEVETGGGYVVDAEQPDVRARWPNRSTYININGSNWTCRAGSTEWAEVQAYWDTNPNAMGASRPQAHTDARINPSGLLWRLQHSCRLLPVTAEVSHCAEAYHNADVLQPIVGRAYRDHWRVEITELEADRLNQSRKLCSVYGLMWRKLDGSIIPPEERDTYAGPTMCIHGCIGQPCYGPYPSEEVLCSGLTPAKRKIGQGSGGQGGRKWAKRGRKGAADDMAT